MNKDVEKITKIFKNEIDAISKKMDSLGKDIQAINLDEDVKILLSAQIKELNRILQNYHTLNSIYQGRLLKDYFEVGKRISKEFTGLNGGVYKIAREIMEKTLESIQLINERDKLLLRANKVVTTIITEAFGKKSDRKRSSDFLDDDSVIKGNGVGHKKTKMNQSLEMNEEDELAAAITLSLQKDEPNSVQNIEYDEELQQALALSMQKN